jgi:hypothetical protein
MSLCEALHTRRKLLGDTVASFAGVQTSIFTMECQMIKPVTATRA